MVGRGELELQPGTRLLEIFKSPLPLEHVTSPVGFIENLRFCTSLFLRLPDEGKSLKDTIMIKK